MHELSVYRIEESFVAKRLNFRTEHSQKKLWPIFVLRICGFFKGLYDLLELGPCLEMYNLFHQAERDFTHNFCFY